MTKTIDTRTLEASLRRAAGGTDYVSIKSVSEVTGMSENAVWRRFRAHEVPRVGRRNAHYYIPRAAEALMM